MSTVIGGEKTTQIIQIKVSTQSLSEKNKNKMNKHVTPHPHPPKKQLMEFTLIVVPKGKN